MKGDLLHGRLSAIISVILAGFITGVAINVATIDEATAQATVSAAPAQTIVRGPGNITGFTLNGQQLQVRTE